MAQPKKIDKTEFTNSAPIDIRRVRNGYILSEYNHDPSIIPMSSDQLVFNKIEQLYAELKERFESKKED